MESVGGIIWAIIIFCIVIPNLNKSKKKATTQKKPAARVSKPTPMEEFLSSSEPEPATVSPVASPEGVDPCHEQELHGPDLKPTIYGTTRVPYNGSLAANTGEGIDPCHEDQADFMTLLETEGDAPTLAFNWTGPELQKAFVMQEILRRR